MRVQISRHLKVRAITIRTAIKNYNNAAASLDPPREKLNINKVLSMAFLSDFDALRYTRPGNDISQKPWSKPSVRVLTDKHFELLRAKEELVRLNMEWRRVRAWISDERALFLATIDSLKENGNRLQASALQSRWHRVEKGHRIAQHWLAKTRRLDGFSAYTGPGKAINKEKGRDDVLSSTLSSYRNADDVDEFFEDDNDNGEVELSREELISNAGLLNGHLPQLEREGDLIDSIGRMAI